MNPQAAEKSLPGRADVYYHLALALEAAQRPNDALRSDQHIVSSINSAESRHVSSGTCMDTGVVGFQDFGCRAADWLRRAGHRKHQADPS